MGQEEVITFLKKIKKPVSRLQIAEALKCDPINISHSIKRLLKYNEIKFIEIDRFEAMKSYRCQRRVKLYYI